MAEREQNTRPTLSFSIDNILRDDFPKSSRVNRPSPFAPASRTSQGFRPSMACHECFTARYRPVYIYSTSSVSDKEVSARGVRSHSNNQAKCARTLEAMSKSSAEQGNSTNSNKTTVNAEPNKTEVYCKQENDASKTKNDQKDHSKDKKKRFRSHFSQLQLQYLESIFARQHYLSRDERTLLATALDMTELQVRNWFQNKRYQKRHREIQALQKVGKQVPVKILVSDRSPVIPALGVRPGEMMRY